MKKINIFIIMLLCGILVPLSFVQASNTKYEAIDKIQLKDATGILENVKELSNGNYLGIVNKAATIFDKDGNTIAISEEVYYATDAMELNNGKILITANGYSDTGDYVCDSNLENCTTLSYEKIGHPTGAAIYKIDNNYYTIGGESNEYNIIVNKIDADGNYIESYEHELGTAYSYYYGTMLDDKTIYFITTNSSDDYSLVSFNNGTFKENTLNCEKITDDEYDEVTEGTFTTLIKVGNDFYFSTSYGIYKIDKDYNLTKVINSRENLYDDEDDKEGADYTSIVHLDNYFILGGLYQNADSTTSALIEIYDNNFKLQERINLNQVLNVEPLESAFSIVKNLTISKDGYVIATGIMNEWDYSSEGRKAYLAKLKLYNVYTKTDGRGTISYEYVDGQVKFTLTPDEGYVLGSVLVTDSAGNKITFTNNTFTMPSSDVTISATFIKKEVENPNTTTKGLILGSTIVVAIISLSIVFIFDNKKKHFKIG